jgi:hypothetical protein
MTIGAPCLLHPLNSRYPREKIIAEAKSSLAADFDIAGAIWLEAPFARLTNSELRRPMDDQGRMMHPKDKDKLVPFMVGKEKPHPNPSQRHFYGTPKSMAGGTTKTKRGSSSKPSRGR